MNIIEFEGSPLAGKNSLVPTVSMVPEWYKKSSRKVKDDNGNETPGMKACVPFLDAMSVGYVMLLAQDLYVEQTEDGPSVRYKAEPAIVGTRGPKATSPMPAPPGYDEEHFVWHTQTAVHIPEGYSAFFTHPLNRFDLPFITLSGCVDGDFYMHGGNVPFHIKKGFTGVIPAGTPMLQLILFETRDWKSKEVSGLWEKAENQTKGRDYGLGSWYRRRKWKKKSYK